MGLQVWCTESIENILWATQTIVLATPTVVEENERSVAYCDSFNQGFEAGFDRIIKTFYATPSTLRIWTQDHIRNILHSTPLEMQSRTASSIVDDCSAGNNWGFYQGLEAVRWCLATSFGINLWPLANGALFGRRILTAHAGPWFREDVQHILVGMQHMMEIASAAMKNSDVRPSLEQGVEDALRFVAHSFGLRLLLPGNSSLSEGAPQLWHRQTIERKLHMAHQSLPSPTMVWPQEAQSTVYRRAFLATVQGIAISFGIRLKQL